MKIIITLLSLILFSGCSTQYTKYIFKCNNTAKFKSYKLFVKCRIPPSYTRNIADGGHHGDQDYIYLYKDSVLFFLTERLHVIEEFVSDPDLRKALYKNDGKLKKASLEGKDAKGRHWKMHFHYGFSYGYAYVDEASLPIFEKALKGIKKRRLHLNRPSKIYNPWRR